ncbi:MAG: anaerobic ribonucleoside-triphosphate reductase activating protein [Bacteroidales bacterium]|nr:anaerobic ribonucleoside-triphosphate reductase activating protein [Bacteroidales bacterium]
MRIGGFVKQSFIDWEGKICAVLFTKGCNFRCGYCHNPHLVLPRLYNQSIDVDYKYITEYLVSRRGWLDGVVISGGEPTIHKDLPQLIESIKKIGYQIKLDTNGSNPGMIKSIITNRLADYIAMDIKTVTETELYKKICGISDNNLCHKIESSIQLLKESGVPYELRTTLLPNHHTKDTEKRLKARFSYCNYKFQEFREFVSD